MSALDDFRATVNDAQQAAYYAKWVSQNPVLAARWAAYRDGLLAGQNPPSPSMGANAYGRMLVDFGIQYAHTLPVDPQSPDPLRPGSTGLPVTTLVDAFLPVNLVARADLSDYEIDGSHDSAVLLQHDAHGTTLRRFNVSRCCDLSWTNAWARHGIYAKVRDLLVEDFRCVVVPGGPEIGQVISARMANQVYRRVYGEGAPFVVGFFQENDDYLNAPRGVDAYTKGTLLFEDVNGKFLHQDTGAWLDRGTALTVGQTFTFRRCHWTGPSTAKFAAASAAFSAASGAHATFEGCTLNGRAVTADMLSFPPGTFSIV